MHHHHIARVITEAHAADTPLTTGRPPPSVPVTADPRRPRRSSRSAPWRSPPGPSPSLSTTSAPRRTSTPRRSPAITTRAPLPARSRSPTRSAGREAPAPEPACSSTATTPPNTPAPPVTRRAGAGPHSRGIETNAPLLSPGKAGVSAARDQTPAADELRSSASALPGLPLRPGQAEASASSESAPGVRPLRASNRHAGSRTVAVRPGLFRVLFVDPLAGQRPRTDVGSATDAHPRAGRRDRSMAVTAGHAAVL